MEKSEAIKLLKEAEKDVRNTIKFIVNDKNILVKCKTNFINEVN